MEPIHILVVDDETDLCEIIKFNLENAGYLCHTVFSAEEALTLDLSIYNLFIFDIMMGEISGYTLAHIIRKNNKTNHIPIIFVTAKDTEADTLKGFEMGADDYITKPFSVRELVARVKVVLRRQNEKNSSSSESIINYKNFLLNINLKKLYIDKNEVILTKKEFGILELLLKNPHHIFSRQQILESVWDKDVYVLDRTIDVNIARLRKKIEPYNNFIISRSGFGYCFDPES